MGNRKLRALRTMLNCARVRACGAVTLLATYCTLIQLPYMDAMVQGLRLKHTMHQSTVDGHSIAPLLVAHELLYVHTRVGRALKMSVGRRRTTIRVESEDED